MELPTTVRQIGNVGGNGRVYIEDYVYTYLNELKTQKCNFPLRVALFGHVYHKGSQTFYLVYGAANVVDELAGGRNEEQVRKEFFALYDLIGYVNIYGNKQELPGKKDGYYIFYDKNESMQNYLLFCYEQKKRKRDRKDRQTSVSIKDIIKRLIYGSCIIILTIAVTSINDYDKMYGFVKEAGKAVAYVGAGR